MAGTRVASNATTELMRADGVVLYANVPYCAMREPSIGCVAGPD